MKHKQKELLGSAVRVLGTITVLVLIFLFGLNVGNGNIVFNRGTFNKGVSQGLPSNLDYSTVNKVYSALKKDYDGQLDESKLTDGLKQGLASSTGDPYTEYFSPKEAQQFNDELNNSFTGIGAELGKDSSGNLIIVSPIKGFPAAKAGLKPQDIITNIDGTSTNDMTIGDAVNRIRGKKGTKVTLKIVRNKSQTLNFPIVRADIKLPSVTSKVIGNVGYMQISTFSSDTADLAQKAAAKFKKAHVKGVILDLRDNPGGLLEKAVSVSSLWLPEGRTVLQEKRGGVVVNTYTAEGGDILNGLPTVVLINDGSASASEITAGALHDNHAAVLMGVKSYGKGSVQQVEDFADGGELKVTIARWYRPNGQNIDKKGITPDKIVQLSDRDIKNGNDTQLKAAEAYLRR